VNTLRKAIVTATVLATAAVGAAVVAPAASAEDTTRPTFTNVYTLSYPSDLVNGIPSYPHRECLNVLGGSKADDVSVIQWQCPAGTLGNDRWNFIPVTDIKKVVNVHSGLCLNVAGGSKAPGVRVIQYSCVPNALNDKWLFRATNTGGVVDNVDVQLVNDNSGLCLNVQGGSTADGAPLIQYGCTDQTSGPFWPDNDVWDLASGL
jgi:hypothetical protein